jgi:hypothetical protein
VDWSTFFIYLAQLVIVIIIVAITLSFATVMIGNAIVNVRVDWLKRRGSIARDFVRDQRG